MTWMDRRAQRRSVIVLSVLTALLLYSWHSPGTIGAADPGEIQGDLPPGGGVALAVWGGGSLGEMQGAAAAGGCDLTAAWQTHDGEFYGFIYGAPEFVNADFLALISGDELPAGTTLILVCQPMPDAPDAPDASAFLPSQSEIAAYRAAVDLRDSGDYGAAADAFGDVAASGSPLAPMAILRAAQMLEREDADSAAVDAYQQAIGNAALPPSLRNIARVDGAALLRDLDRDQEALAVMDQITADNGASDAQIAWARWNRANIMRSAGAAGWQDHAIFVVRSYPGTTYARTALNALENAGVSVAPLEAALVRYLHRENSDARSHYEPIAAGGGANAATAWFYLGALEERADDREAAIEAYERSVELAPSGPLADDALWWTAILLSNGGDRTEASATYETLAATIPGSSYAADASVRAALLRVQDGATDLAFSGLQAMLDRSAGSNAARAARWLRVLGATAPDPAQFEPRSLPALLDAAGGNADQPLPSSAQGEWIDGAGGDWSEVSAWMQSRHGAPTEMSEANRNRLRLGFGLAQAGEPSVARSVLQGHISGVAGQPHDLLTISRAAQEIGMHDISVSAAERLLSGLTAAERMQTPRALEQLAYPAPWASETLSASQTEDVPPLLMLALVRRESMFHPQAGSVAGAQGLAQIMPATGEDIARSLGVTWNPSMLLDPATSLQFGAHYLGMQLDNFNGDVFGALAAYNGGGGNASRWYSNQYESGADWYVETVDFSETRRYLHVVLEDYAWYRHIYGHTSTPAIR